ncbi:MAG: hypothetical protein AB1782_08805 [Cyanobacteriota bacterium]
MKLGIDAEKFLTNWALENSEELVTTIEDALSDDSFSDKEKVKFVYTKTLNFVFAAISEIVNENNKVLEKQLRRAGINLPFIDI